jgi:hypothetical protein
MGHFMKYGDDHEGVRRVTRGAMHL